MPRTARGRAARLPSRESRGCTPKPPPPPPRGGASSPGWPHRQGRGWPRQHPPAHRAGRRAPQQQRGRGAPRWEWGFTRWHVVEQGPKPAWGRFPWEKAGWRAAATVLEQGRGRQEGEKPFGHVFSFLLLLSCLFPALLQGARPPPGPRAVRWPPPSGWRRPWEGPGGCPPGRVSRSQPLAPSGGPTPSTPLCSAPPKPGALPPHTCAGSGSPWMGSPPRSPPDAVKEKDAVKAAWLPTKVLKEIIACIKIFTPAKGLKTFPGALNSDWKYITVHLRLL